ncbi:phage tail sheath subtilisin-like domain-containing protein [Vogesella sp. GCM10023246]|uniref:Phage tail sheath subtilisin-like domain-containing protein n=1 Tax=Vogesella oryzagri TaxID=3160864 RepID=A0ABV1M7L8_9NEIS
MKHLHLLFTTTNLPLSLLIRARAGGPFSHVALVDGDQLIEATAGHGVRTAPLTTAITRASRAALMRIPSHNADQVLAAARSQIGKRYDWSGIAGIVAVGVEANADLALQTSAIIGGVTAGGVRTGLQALLDGKSAVNLQPRLLVAPGHSSTQAVASAMDSLAGKLRAISIIDGPNTTDDEAIAYAANFGSKRLYLVDAGGNKVWDTTSSSEILLPSSGAVAGLFAAKDAEVGFWASPSNTEFAEVLGTGRPVEYLYGDPTCRANLLNQAYVSTIIRDGGFRLWGNRTLSADPKWSFVTRVRTTDMVMDAILRGHQWAVDIWHR